MNDASATRLAGVFQGREPLVVLAPHPDDESLACGALLARGFAGAGAHVICLTDGSASHPASRQWPPDRLAARRRAELSEAVSRLGGAKTDLTWLGLPDSRLHLADPMRVAEDLDRIVTGLGAAHVFVPAIEDHHADHKATFRIALILRQRRPDLTFHAYPVWSRWDEPDFAAMIAARDPVFVPPGRMAGRKRAAIHAHRTQMGRIVRDDPFGFVLPDAMIRRFLDEDEIFWRMPA
ncbi:PIG-L family deacetylase [Paracoccus stylophorae]|uniref:PIG-L family deacetylase n=1 Tax=Paracoccus stylophorae TaxID=659350 RepID=A0ABY7SUZ6_9RHOB|nr:PIG-L family deacetylase [Paracoccus stylophorae]WCR10683.1 PIG-L family deacetylase [Paracoccus stylophorae]